MHKLDSFDKKILKELQKNAHISHQELANKVNLSKTPCWRRVRKLEEMGVIKNYVAILNPTKIGLSVMAYVQVSMKNHDIETLNIFNDFITQSPYILECSAITGNYDYLMKVTAQDTHELEKFLMNKLLTLNVVQSTNSNFILGQRKNTTQLPIQL
ncbi:MAG: Lrp/AsnC family transcriptional regulator [Marinicellaceae bacterium]